MTGLLEKRNVQGGQEQEREQGRQGRNPAKNKATNTEGGMKG